METKVVFENNTAKVDIAGVKYPFAGYRSFHPKDKHVKEFADIDVKLFNVFPSGIMTALKNRTIPYSQYGAVWVGEDEYNWDNLKKQTDVFSENAPDGYVVLMIHLDPPDWFVEKYEDVEDTWSCFISGAGSERWKAAAVRYMKALMEKVEEYMPDRVYAYHMMGGGTTEWITRNREDVLNNPTQLHIDTYRKWCNDEAAEIPTYKEFIKEEDGIFVTNENVLRYRRFLSEVTADTMLYFADKAKEFCGGKKIVSSFFGYLGLDLVNTVYDGACATLRVYNSDSVNMIACPASYNFRKRYSTSSFRIPVDSLTLHNVLYIHEIDAQTHVLQKKNIEPIHIPEIDDTFCTVEESASYLRREVGMTLAKGQGFWFFDMMGGWYSDDEMMAEAEKVRRLSAAAGERPHQPIAEVAVFIDTESNYYIGDDKLHYTAMELQMRDLNLTGFTWDMYMTDDLCMDNFDLDRYKLYIFPNLCAVRPHIKEQILKLRKMGKSILFMHAPGYINERENLKELTGMDLHLAELDSAKSTLSGGGSIDFSDEVTTWGAAWGQEQKNINFAPYYYIDNADTEIAKFNGNGKASIGINKRPDGSFDAYSAIAPLDENVMCELAKAAGVFQYADSGNVIYANSSIVTLYSFRKQNMRLRWTKKIKLREFFTGEEYIVDENGVDIPFEEYQTKVFFTETGE